MRHCEGSPRGFLTGGQISQKLDEESAKIKLNGKLLDEKQCKDYAKSENEHPGTIYFPEKCMKEIATIYFTSYNPVPGQTDSTPCIAGGTGYNLCAMAKNGERAVAFSQDLLKWSGGEKAPFGKGDLVWLKSTTLPNDPRCNGTFTVSDGMNSRFRMRGDIFTPNRKNNLDCKAKVYKITP